MFGGEDFGPRSRKESESVRGSGPLGAVGLWFYVYQGNQYLATSSIKVSINYFGVRERTAVAAGWIDNKLL